MRFGRVLKVGGHEHEHRIAACAKNAVGRAAHDPEIFGVEDHFDARVVFGDLAQDGDGAVGRAIVRENMLALIPRQFLLENRTDGFVAAADIPTSL